MTFIIADVGVNHDGDLFKAVVLTKSAAEAGVDAVKFQYFHSIWHAKGNVESLKLLQPLELSFGQLTHLAGVCKTLGVEFMCTPFDRMAAENIKTLGVKRIKIGSGQVKDHALLKVIGSLDLPCVISNGMCNDADMAVALNILPADTTILSCVSLYPTPDDAIQLSEIARLKRKFERPIGFSCHSPSLWPSVAAAALGATIIEKHVTISREDKGPDHASSLEICELKTWVREIRSAAS